MRKTALFASIFFVIILSVCFAQAIVSEECTDGAMNGDETGIDCGGSCVTADVESCNGLDDNYDCQIDEEGASGCTIYYYDSDSDNYGITSDSRCLCTVFGDHTATIGGDCDDANNGVNPGASDVCNGVDDDCNAATADGSGETAPLNSVQEGVCLNSQKSCALGSWQNDFSNVLGYEPVEVSCEGLDNDCDGFVDEGLKTNFFRDADGDGFGNPAVSTNSCTKPDGFVAGNTDCDDTKATVYTGAPELCDNIDNDCDLIIDEGFTKGGACSKGMGQCASSGTAVCSQDGLSVECNAVPKLPQTEICDGKDNDCDGITDGSESLTRQCGVSDLALCTFGTETCDDSGKYVGCTAVFPKEDIPDNGADENCDGKDQHCEILPLSEIYNQKRVSLNVNCEMQYKSILYSLNGQRFQSACPRCKQFTGQVSPKEGQNSLIIRVQGYNDLTTDYALGNFFVDSIKPTIIKVSPMRGFTTGTFSVTYSEENPRYVTLFYREIGKDWSTNVASDCPKGRNKVCEIKATLKDVGDYEFYFKIEDIAGNLASSAIFKVKADVVAPVLSIGTPFAGIYNSMKVLFDVLSTEKGTIGYIEKAKETKLCIACTAFNKFVNFQSGWHDITIFTRDDAGNIDTETARFLVDYTKPRIISTEPSRGFASGSFTIKYSEENCKDLVIDVAGKTNGFGQRYDCLSGTNMIAQHDLDLSDYKGEKIDYTVTITDIAGNSASKVVKGLTV